ncbi:flavin reductase family protein [Shinella sp. CPCC 100929]|uniref:Flavin reductase family protein n=1 Tax=Shinella lacus TaxID=2654216 RepID=A0ABT1RCC8_9HYPH|nr:flavin reductase family protein [Shinella lacus]MCQ4632651.1 flavin reductase family protein [Shinella lacus]
MIRAELPPYEGDTAHLRKMFSYFPSGVVALLANVGGTPKGMVASSFTVGVSMEPPLVSCAIRRQSSTWPELKGAHRIGISVFGEDQGEMARQISSKSIASRFEKIPLRHADSSALFIAQAPVWFECSFADELPAGDHTIALLEVHRGGADPELPPLVFYGSTFRQLQVSSADG